MNGFEEPLRLPLLPDWRRRRGGQVVIVLALTALWISAVAGWLKAVLTAAIAMLVVHENRCIKERECWSHLQRLPSGNWQLLQRGGEGVECVLTGRHLNTPWLIVVHAQVAGKPVSLWFWRTDHDPDAWRRLAIYISQPTEAGP